MSQPDALGLLSTALNQGDGTAAQTEALTSLTAALQAQPALIPTLWSALLNQLQRAGEGMRRWIVISLMEGTLCGPQLSMDAKASLATQSIDAFERVIDDPDAKLRKAIYACFASVYPLLFKHMLWERIARLKSRMTQDFREGSLAMRPAATKVAQKVIQTQTRASADPRIASRATDPSLALCPSHHPFLRSGDLESEANKLLEASVGVLYTNRMPDAVIAVVNALALLVRPRPSLAPVVIGSLINWSPASNLTEATPMQVKSVEKTVRIALANLVRTSGPTVTAQSAQINDYLHRQSGRMQQAAEAALRAREQAATLKRSRIADELSQSTAQTTKKRKKNRKAAQDKAASGGGSTFSRAIAGQIEANAFDVKSLPLAMVAELIINNLQVVQDAALAAAIAAERKELSAAAAAAGPINPLEMDVEEESESEDSDDEDDEDDPALAGVSLLDEFKLPPPEPLATEKRTAFLTSALDRLCAPPQDGDTGPLWVLMLVRLATRGSPSSDAADIARQALFDYISADPAIRLGVARSWMLEEWNGGETDAYARWLTQLLDRLSSHVDLPHGDPGFKAVAQFIVDLPEVSRELCERLRDMCTQETHLQAGFTALRDLTALRPPVRKHSLDMLFSLATHPERTTRNAAILTLKRWAPDTPALGEPVIKFALSLLQRAEIAPPEAVKPEADGEEAAAKTEENGAMDVDQKPAPETYANVVNQEVVDGLPPPANETQVIQHIELFLALCSKSPDMLDDLFNSFARMPKATQDHVRSLVTMLIRSLGPSHPKLIDLLRSHPDGSDDLAITCLSIMTDRGRSPSQQLVELVREMSTRGKVSPHYLVPVLSEFDRSEILRLLPSIIELLGSKPPEKALVQQVFENVTTTSAFGTQVSTNVVRVKTSELLTPVELLSLLHTIDKSVGLKPAIEAITLCFSMTDLFKSETWAAFMSQALDEPSLPTLFLRTVLQAVTVHKTLVPFVSTTLLSRLVTKKVWQTPQLWDGFVRCARSTAPGSYASVLQLPKDQLKDLVFKQPALRQGLREHVTKRMASNQARQHALLEILAAE